MRKKLQIGFATVLLILAVATLTFVIRSARGDRDAAYRLYTRTIKKHDIADTARNALAALSDAEIREQNYVLTGETVYSEAYEDDIRTWQDEFAALELVVRNDPAAPLVQDLSKAGTRTMSELASVVSLYDKSGRDAALDRIRKGSGIVYLDQARNSVAKILEIDAGAADGNTLIVGSGVSALRRLAIAAAVLFGLTVSGTLLLILETRREP